MTPTRPSRLLPVAVLGTALCALAAGLAVPATARPARPVGRHGTSAAVTLAPGVTLQHVATQIGGDTQQLTMLSVDLTKPGVSIDSASPADVVGSERASVKTQTNARHALAGVNADFFDLNNDSASPRGVLVTSGRMLKSPTTVRNANLVVRRSASGAEVASVGALTFDAQVQRLRKDAHNHVSRVTRTLTSVNSLVSARAGGVSLVTAALAPSELNRPCSLATGRIVHGVWTVASVRTSAYSTPSMSSTTWGLLSCAGDGKRWIRSTLRPGDQLVVSDAIAGGTPWAAISGGSVLVRNGRKWNDPDGEILPYDGRNAETFACVAKGGRQLTLGTIDGYTQDSPGVTYDQLTGYMLSLGNACWSGLVVDGGGSTTMVAKLPGSSKATVQNVPAEDPPRHVADTVVVFGK